MKINKKILLLNVLFFTLPSFCGALNEKVSKKKIIKNINFSEKNNNKDYFKNDLKENNELLLDENTNRIIDILDLYAFFEQYQSESEVANAFDFFIKNFFGLGVRDKILDNTQKQLFIENLVGSVTLFNLSASTDLKYLCDMQIKYILSLKKIIFNKIKKNTVHSLILISYYYYLFNPTEYIDWNTLKENEEEISEKQINWQEAAMDIPLEFAEIGLLKDNYLYNLYDSIFTQKLFKNKKYIDILLIKKYLPDLISQDDNAIECLLNRYNKNIIFFKNDLNLINLYRLKQDTFLIWLFDKKNIINALEQFFNEDSLFILFVSVLLYKSILKVDYKYYYPSLDNDMVEQFEKIAKQAEFILYQLFSSFNSKMYIQWDDLPNIIITEERLMNIIKYFNLINLL